MDELALGTFTKLLRCAQALETHLSQTVDLPKELRGSGFPILEALYHKGALTQCELARKILRTNGNISLALDKLEAQGLLQRQPGADRRSYLIHLTDQGRELISQVFPRMAQGISKALGALEPQEQAQLGELCKKLGRTLVR